MLLTVIFGITIALLSLLFLNERTARKREEDASEHLRGMVLGCADALSAERRSGAQLMDGTIRLATQRDETRDDNFLLTKSLQVVERERDEGIALLEEAERLLKGLEDVTAGILETLEATEDALEEVEEELDDMIEAVNCASEGWQHAIGLAREACRLVEQVAGQEA